MDKSYFHIKAHSLDIFKPEGKTIKFWLYMESEEKVRERLNKDGHYSKIYWIRQEKPPFED